MKAFLGPIMPDDRTIGVMRHWMCKNPGYNRLVEKELGNLYLGHPNPASPK